MDSNLICLHCMAQLNEPKGICSSCGFDNLTAENAITQMECGSILAGAYLVGCVLGQGGFGITYIGLDLNLETKVAIKEYYPEGCVTREVRAHSCVIPLSEEKKQLFEKGKLRFINEAQILAKFAGEQPIVGVRSFFYENGTAYIVMDFVEGETLKNYAERRGGRLPSAEVLELIRPLCDSLIHIHKAGLLHRDISPDNIMITKDGSVILIDFGSARQFSMEGEHSNTINVKHGFAPEEQYRTHGEQGPWTDVYALCATVYRLTTGRTPPQALDRLTSGVPLTRPNQLGADFSLTQETAILHGLAIKSTERVKNLDQLIEELHFDSGEKLIQRTYPLQHRFDYYEKKPELNKKKNRLKYIVPATAVGVGILLITVLLLAQNKPDNDFVPLQSTSYSNQTFAAETTTEPTPTMTLQVFAPVGTVVEGRLAAGDDYSLVLKNDGTVICYGGDKTGVYEDVQSWEDIIWISGYDTHAVGIRSNGTLARAGDDENGELEVLDLTDVTQVVTGKWYTVVLTRDGKVQYRGVKLYNLSECESWINVKTLLGGDDHLAAIFNDGTIRAVGYAGYGQCKLGEFKDVIGGTVSSGTTFVINANGTVTPKGKDFCGEDDVRGWTNVIAIDGGEEHTVGLRSDGTIKVAGSSKHNLNIAESWTSIVAICAGTSHTIGIDMYGGLHMVGELGTKCISGDGLSIYSIK